MSTAVIVALGKDFFKKKKQKHTLLYRCASAFFLLLPQNKMEYIVLCKKI